MRIAVLGDIHGNAPALRAAHAPGSGRRAWAGYLRSATRTSRSLRCPWVSTARASWSLGGGLNPVAAMARGGHTHREHCHEHTRGLRRACALRGSGPGSGGGEVAGGAFLLCVPPPGRNSLIPFQKMPLFLFRVFHVPFQFLTFASSFATAQWSSIQSPEQPMMPPLPEEGS